MSKVKLITKEILLEEAYKNQNTMRSVVYKNAITAGSDMAHVSNEAEMDTIIKLKDKEYKSFYSLKRNGRESVESRIASGNFSLHVPADLYDFVDATRLVLANALGLLGIDAPEQM